MIAARSYAAFAHACLVILSANAQAEEAPISRIGVVAAPVAYQQGLRDGLLKLGFIEGKNIVIDARQAGGSVDELRALATNLLQSKPDVIVAFGTAAVRVALELGTAPIVFYSSDPVASGLVTSLARPGGNATGVSSSGVELTAKRVELLRQFLPRARRIGCLVNTSNPVGALQLEQAKKAARALGLELVKLDAHDDVEVEAVLRAIRPSALDEILVTGDNLLLANRLKISKVVRNAKVPAMSPVREFLGEGILVSYGPSVREAGRMTAVYVGKILKGAKPADLPVEEVSKFELVIDLRVARELGLKVSQDLLYRADEVIR